MAKFIINGGAKISGKHKTPGNKNAALPMLAACVLTEEPVHLTNVPMIKDVHTMLEILSDLGVSVEVKNHTVALCAKGIRKTRLNPELCSLARSSLLFAGPLTARLGKATLYPPGGDVIGRRRIDTHIEGLRQLGISFKLNNSFSFQKKNFQGAKILLDEASVTATENIVMSAVLAPGCTTVFNAACEPHVQDLCHMLNKMGARISGIGTNYLRIRGVDSLHGVKHRVSPDYVDAVSFAAAAILTGGALKIENIPAGQLDVIEKTMFRLGLKWQTCNGSLSIPPNQNLRIRNDIGSAIPKIEDGVWPNFPSDLMSIAIVLATQSRGTVLFFEKMFESRLYFVDRLIEMGARIVQCDPHRVVISGPAPLHGTQMSSPDIRAGIALLLAALSAKGTSIIGNAEVIDRGYEKIDQKLRALGADIERVN